jgi:hypothetical protein
MAGAGCDDVTMASVMLDSGLEIGTHIREKPDPTKYLERQIGRARRATANSTSQPPPRSRVGPQSQAEVNSDRNRLLLNMQRTELRRLHRMRGINSPFDTWAAESGIDLRRLYDPGELGILIEFTAQEDERFATDPIGRPEKWYLRRGHPVILSPTRFPKRLRPAGATKDQTIERRKMFNRQKRAAAERRRRAEKGAAKHLKLQQAAELDCRKSAIFTVLSDEWMTIKDLMKALASSPAFMTPDRKLLTGDSLRHAIARELERPDLLREIETVHKFHKNGFPVKLIRRRPVLGG